MMTQDASATAANIAFGPRWEQCDKDALALTLASAIQLFSIGYGERTPPVMEEIPIAFRLFVTTSSAHWRSAPLQKLTCSESSASHMWAVNSICVKTCQD